MKLIYSLIYLYWTLQPQTFFLIMEPTPKFQIHRSKNGNAEFKQKLQKQWSYYFLTKCKHILLIVVKFQHIKAFAKRRFNFNKPINNWETKNYNSLFRLEESLLMHSLATFVEKKNNEGCFPFLSTQCLVYILCSTFHYSRPILNSKYDLSFCLHISVEFYLSVGREWKKANAMAS